MVNLIVMCGNTGVGKTYIANLISQKVSCKHIRGSEVMSESGENPPEPWPYEFRIRNYKRMFDKAKLSLTSNESVILDSVFNLKEFREGAKELAKETKANYVLIEVICDEETNLKRLQERAKNGNLAHHLKIHELRKKEFEPIKEPHCIINNSSNDMEKRVSSIIGKLF